MSWKIRKSPVIIDSSSKHLSVIISSDLSNEKLFNAFTAVQRFIRQSSNSHQRVVIESSDGHQMVIRQSSGSHQAVISWSSDFYQIFISFETQQQCQNTERINMNQLEAWLDGSSFKEALPHIWTLQSNLYIIQHQYYLKIP